MTSNDLTSVHEFAFPAQMDAGAVFGGSGAFEYVSLGEGGKVSRNRVLIDPLAGITPEDVTACQQFLPRMDEFMRVCSPDEMAIWCKRLVSTVAMSVKNPLDAKGRKLRASALQLALGEILAVVWTRDLLADAAARYEFFPSVKEMKALLDEHSGKVMGRIERIRTIASAKVRRADAVQVIKLTEAEKSQRKEISDKIVREFQEAAERDDAVRKYGTFMKPEWEPLSGPDLANSLEAELPSMSGWFHTITLERIAMLRRAAKYAQDLHP